MASLYLQAMSVMPTLPYHVTGSMAKYVTARAYCAYIGNGVSTCQGCKTNFTVLRSLGYVARDAHRRW